jgi:23S rRNA pseudouridine2605 synthase
MEERLQKALAHAGVASRRAAERLVTEGRVAVNGHIVRTLGARVDLARDALVVDGRRLATSPRRTYLALHKPRGYLSTARDERGRPTVLDLVKSSERVYPVGRLDLDSEGLLLLTDDGDLALRVTHPRYGVSKEYHALVRGVPSASVLAHLRRGVELEEGRARAAEVALVSTEADRSWVRIVLRQGWKRQVRRMLAVVGYPVERLVRTRIGSVDLGALPAGSTRELSAAELAGLRGDAGSGASVRNEAVQHGPTSHRH